MGSELQDFRKRSSKFVILKDGESIEGKYQVFKIGTSPFDPEKEIVNYQINTEYGVKTFQSGSGKVADLFDRIEKDADIRITREGEKNDTKYILEQKTADGSFEEVSIDTVEGA